MNVYCPHCGTQLANSAQVAGQVVVCPGCAGQFQMPALTMPVAQPVYAAPQPAEGALSVPILISAISNLVVGLLWASTCIGLVLAIPMFVLSGFEFALYSKFGRQPLAEIARRASTLGIFEVILGLFNTPVLVCGIIVLVNAGKFKQR